MISLSKYFFEKLKLDKNIAGQSASNSIRDIAIDYPDNRDYQKMMAYKQKGSDPKRLVSSIKDRSKLERRFRQAVEMKWDAAVREFAKGIVDRGYFTQEEIDKWLSKNYRK